MIPLEDIERLYEAVKALRDERRKAERISKRAFAAEGRQRQKASVDLNWQAMHVERLTAAAHAAAVDAGIADLRDPSYYADRVSRPSAWHDYRWTPALPRALATAGDAP